MTLTPEYLNRSPKNTSSSRERLMILWAALVLSLSAWMMVPIPVRAENPVMGPMEPADHFRHSPNGGFYVESWNYQLMTDTQEMIYLAFVASRVGMVSSSAGIDFTWAMRDGREISINDERDFSDLKEDRGEGLIAIGPHAMTRQGQTTRLVVSTERLRADLAIRSWMPGFKIRDGRIHADEEKNRFHFFFVEIPRGDFKGTLTIDGRKHAVRGSAYMDHSYANVPATDFSSRWYSLRAFYPEHTVAFTEFRASTNAEDRPWALGYVTDSKKVMGVSTHYALEPSVFETDANGCAIPRTGTIRMDLGEAQLAGRYENQALYCRKPIFGEVSWAFRKLITAFAGDPVVYRFLADTAFVLKTPEARIPLEGPALKTTIVLKE